MKTPAVRAALTLLACALASNLPGQEELRIGRISIESYDVFTPEEAQNGWVYRAANALHIETRVSIIRKFLLFTEGDPYDPIRLEETERNLRALSFIKAASVLAGPPHEGLVDVNVRTQDSWTTQPGLNFGKKGGVTTYSFSLEEKNLLGYARQLSVSYGQEPTRIIRQLQYKDPQFPGPYWTTNLVYSANSDGEEEGLEIGRPFYSFLSPWATNLVLDHLVQNERIFTDGVESSILHQNHHQYGGEYGHALEANDRLARRLTVGFQALRDKFQTLPDRPGDVLPDDREFKYLYLRYEDVFNDFIKVNFVNKDSRFEDFNLGLAFAVTLGVSPSAFGVERTTELIRAQATRGWRTWGSSFVQARLAYETRLDSGPKNEILSARVNGVWKFDTDLLQTLVSRIQVDLGWNLDRDVQFFADGDNGLRGYHLYSFEGNKRVLWNIEHRIFSGKEVLQLVSFGAAAFFDTGTAVPEGMPLKLSEFKSDVGVGIRMGITRAAFNSIVRLDIAYALNPDPFGRKGWLVSFSSGQAF